MNGKGLYFIWKAYKKKNFWNYYLLLVSSTLLS